MSFVGIPIQTGGAEGATEYGLPVRKSAQSGRIETAERMKRAAFVRGATNRSIQKGQIERGIVPDQNCALAFGVVHGLANRYENVIECFAFRTCGAKWVVRIDPCDLECTRFEVSAGERDHMT